MPYTPIFFDLDGTLTDPIEGITKSVQYALATFGIEEEAERLRPFIGPPLHRSFMTYYHFDEATARRAVEAYREYFAERGIYENVLFDGIPELLRALRADGRSLCVVTSKPTFFADQIVRHFGLDPYFDHVIGSNLDLSNADKMVLVQQAIGRYPDRDSAAFVMIGDREHDIIGGKANVIATIGVTYGAGTREEIVAARPTVIIDSVQALGAYLLG
jgi:phosphoglycolate phosphatase